MQFPVCMKVLQKHIADERIAQDIKSKLDTTPGIAYSEIAKKASECGRTQLAVRVCIMSILVDGNPSKSNCVYCFILLDRGLFQ